MKTIWDRCCSCNFFTNKVIPLVEKEKKKKILNKSFRKKLQKANFLCYFMVHRVLENTSNFCQLYIILQQLSCFLFLFFCWYWTDDFILRYQLSYYFLALLIFSPSIWNPSCFQQVLWNNFDFHPHHFTLLRKAAARDRPALFARAWSQFTWVLRGAKSSYEHSISSAFQIS